MKSPHQRELSKLVIMPIGVERIKNGQCPLCCKPKSEWKRTTKYRCCSKECTQRFYNTMLVCTSWNDLRAKVLQRDEYVCQKCGLGSKMDNYGSYHNLVADHIIPIAVGGQQWSFDNLQTLCVSCHKEKTKKDIKKISIIRRVSATKDELQCLLDEATKMGDFHEQ